MTDSSKFIIVRMTDEDGQDLWEALNAYRNEKGLTWKELVLQSLSTQIGLGNHLILQSNIEKYLANMPEPGRPKGS